MSEIKEVTAVLAGPSDVKIQVIRIVNPFNPRDFVFDELTWVSSQTLDQYLPGPQAASVVSINGKIVQPEDFSTTYLDSADNLVICPIPTGGDGNGKSILAIVAMIAVTVFTGGAGASLAGSIGLTGTAATIGGAIIQAGITVAGSMLVNALIAPAKATDSNTGYDSRSSYGIDGPKNTSTEGICVPVGYGKFRMAGNILGLYVENTTDETQTAYMLVSAGEGSVSSLTDLQLNDTPIADFKYVEVQTRLGDANQTPIPWFSDTIIPQNKNQKLSDDWFNSTTSSAVDKVRLDFVAPQGLFIIDQKSGKTTATSVEFEVQYRVAGSSGSWIQMPTTSQVVSWVDVVASYTGPGTYDPLTGRVWTSGAGGTVVFLDNPQFTWTGPAGLVTDPVQLQYLKDNAPKFNPPVMSTDFGADQAPYETSPSFVGNRIPTYSTVVGMVSDRRSTVRASFSSPKLANAAYEIRVRRTKPASKDIGTIDNVYLSDINEILTQALSYPNTALVAIKIKLTDQLSSLPKLTYVNGGKMVQVYGRPGTYASVDQWYSAPSQNPAWIVWDILTNLRYGGSLSPSRLDFVAFKAWADYCEEKNLTWNGVVEQEMNVWDACQIVLRVGHSQLVNIGTRFTIVTEKAAKPVMMFSVANMVEGSYRETWLGTSDRANDIDVTFFDKLDNYRQRTIKLYDPIVLSTGAKQRSSAITLYGVVDYETAYKEAQFQLNLNRYILKTVSFSAPMEAVACSLGDLIYVQNDMTEWAQAGRFESGSTTSVLKLDRVVAIEGGKKYKVLISRNSVQRAAGSVSSVVGTSLFLTGFSGLDPVKRVNINGVDRRVAGIFAQVSGYGIILDDTTGIAAGATYVLLDTDVIEEYDVVNTAGAGSSTHLSDVTLQSSMSVAPAQYTNWMFGEAEKVKSPFRVNSVSGSHDYIREIRAVQYDEKIYDFSRYGTNMGPIVPPQNGVIGPVRSLQAYEETYVTGDNIISKLVASWQAPQVGMYAGADVYVVINGGAVIKQPEAKNRTSIVIDAVKGDKVVLQVVAYDIFGKRAPLDISPSIAYTVIGETAGIKVGTVTGSGFVWSGRDCKITWRYNATTHSYEFGSEPTGGDAGALDPHFKDYEVRVFDKTHTVLRRTENVSSNSYTYIYDKNFADGLTRNLVFEIRMRDTFNNLGVPTTLEAYNPPPTVVSVSNTSTFESATISYKHSEDPDFAGAQIWLSRNSSDLSDLALADPYLVYKGPDSSVLLPKLMFNADYYFRIAAFDAFGLTELVPTSTLHLKTTFLDVAAIADGVLGDSLLIPALQTRINLIDGPASMANSVAARVLAEAVARGAAVTAETSARQTADSSLATSVSSVTASVASTAAAINTEITARASADAALATQINVVATSTASNAASIYSEQTARTNADAALASSISVVQASSAAASAAVTTEQTARVSADQFIASYINTLFVTSDSHTASIQTQQTVSNGLSAQYTVKIDNNGYVAGFGLASTAVNGVPTSEFIVNADKFAVVMPSYSGVHPFTIGAVNGVPRVIISNALIGDASIGNAMIGNAEVNTLKIAGNAVTVPVGLSGSGSIPSASITLTQPGQVFITVMANAISSGGTEGSLYIAVLCNGVLGPIVGVSMANGYSGSATAIGSFSLGAGTHTVGGNTLLSGGARTIGVTGMFAIGVMR